MRINDKILYKYFLSGEHYQLMVELAEQERWAVLESTFPHTVYTELGLATAGGSVEESVIELIEIDERITRIKQNINRSQEIFRKAIKKIGTRQRIVLFVYFKTGITLTSKYELLNAQETVIDMLEEIKQKEDRLIKKKYMQQFIQK